MDAGRTAHPDILIGATNLALITRPSDRMEIERRLAVLREARGPRHPDVVAAERGLRGECDIEPPPF